MLTALAALPERALFASFRTDDRAYRVAFLVFLSVVIAWTGLLIGIGPVDLTASPQDITGLLDGGWRILNGQVPHNDFYCHLGPGVPYLLALGMAISGPNVYAVILPVLGASLGLGVGAWVIARSRLGAPLALLMSLTVFATTISPCPLGWSPSGTDYAMFYNRMGYAALMVLALECFVRRRIGNAQPFARRTAFTAGLLLAFLLALKVTYFFVALPMVGVAPVFLGAPKKWYVWCAAGFASLAAFIWLALRVQPGAFLRDMWMVYRVARDTQARTVPRLLTLALQLWFNLALMAVAFAMAAWIRRRDFQKLWRCALAVALLVGADLLLGISNAQLPVAVLIPAETLILFELAFRPHPGESYFGSEDKSSPRISLNRILLACSIFLGTQVIIAELGATAYALKERIERGPGGYPGRQIDAAPFREAFMPPLPHAQRDYPQQVNLGLELLRKHATKQSKLVALEFTNPFNVALGLKPANGDAWWLHKNKTFSDHTHPSPDRLFAEADFVIISRRWSRFLWPIYGSYIERNFQIEERNQEWTLFRRKGVAP